MNEHFKPHPFIWDRDLNSISLARWNELYSQFGYVVVGRTQISNVLISTVWIGISVAKRPFETIVFIDGEPVTDERHANEAEAQEYYLTKVKFYLGLEHIGALPVKLEEINEETDSESQ